jgi:hypothetical protein
MKGWRWRQRQRRRAPQEWLLVLPLRWSALLALLVLLVLLVLLCRWQELLLGRLLLGRLRLW